MNHQMKLQSQPFTQIAEGTKTIEIRLNDEKRQQIKVGDTITFTNTATGELANTEVVELLKYNTFEELFSNHPIHEFGAKTSEELGGIYKYYSGDAEQKLGVLGIRIKLSI